MIEIEKKNNNTQNDHKGDIEIGKSRRSWRIRYLERRCAMMGEKRGSEGSHSLYVGARECV